MADNGEERKSTSSSLVLSDDSASRVDIAEITEYDDYQSLTTSGVLSHCKHKILRPYLRLLAVMGLRSFCTDRPNSSKAMLVLGWIHLCQVVLFMALGHVLQYMSCFRRDRGFCYESSPEYSVSDDPSKLCSGSAVYSYAVPSVIHFTAYLYALYLFRVVESEQLENLMERTFLLLAHRIDGPKKQRVLVRNLWLSVALGILWMISSLSSVIIMLKSGKVVMRWIFSDAYGSGLKIILMISTLWHDMVQATIITSYCLQIQLLSSSLHFLRSKLLQHTIPPLSWIREINEYQNFLHYLNNRFAPAVCLFIFVDLSWAASGFTWIFRYDSAESDSGPARAVNVLVTVLWSVAGVVPLVMASLLTAACNMLRRLGHEVRTRPFVYQDTPAEDLNTILLYTSTLKMKCKLFTIPVSARYLIFFLTVSAMLILTLGQSRILTH